MRLRSADPGGLPLGSEVAAILGPLLDPAFPLPPLLDFPIPSLCAPERAGAGSLVCVGQRTRLSVREAWAESPATGAESTSAAPRPALIAAETGVHLPPLHLPVLRIRSAHAALAALLAAWSHRWERESPFAPGDGNRIAPTAVVDGCLEGGVEVGPGAYVGKGAFIGRGTRIGANAVIEAHCHVGRDCEIQPGAVIGCAGFGFYAPPAASRPPIDPSSATRPSSSTRPMAEPSRTATDQLLPMPHPAGVRIGDDCFIGANTVVAAGVLHPTVLGRGCKLDSHVQIAHNVVLGGDCLLASQSGIAGSTQAGDRLRLGGAASVDGHLRLGNDVSVAACSGVTKDFPDGSVVAGFPARPIAAWRKSRIGERRIGPGP
jgi:UDP-3-O-[3-hydroxymyristoyl] glucosamine N-acyltransferase